MWWITSVINHPQNRQQLQQYRLNRKEKSCIARTNLFRNCSPQYPFSLSSPTTSNNLWLTSAAATHSRILNDDVLLFELWLCIVTCGLSSNRTVSRVPRFTRAVAGGVLDTCLRLPNRVPPPPPPAAAAAAPIVLPLGMVIVVVAKVQRFPLPPPPPVLLTALLLLLLLFVLLPLLLLFWLLLPLQPIPKVLSPPSTQHSWLWLRRLPLPRLIVLVDRWW